MYDCLPNLPVPGCNCIDGYFRNASGICVPTDECPPRVYDIKCGPNEIKKDKKTECPPQTCESLYTINFCLPQDPEPGCDCIEGYLRNDFGTCIPSSECPTYDNDFGYSDESEESDYDTNSVSSTTSQSSSSSSSTSQSTSRTNLSD
ncbi:inducible metalloproteinase inhibitor protein-like [Achroia grisella]|uniref:inducible metalloproteinase inhibitor protein-like n=1 Tax=Achroia grisella TaxID=688607 RepID=UPI0027D2ED9D|nr:inducible metalloproteinase inhibitor protein-like [Achroia grisella]